MLIAQHGVDAWVLCLPETESDAHAVFRGLDWRFRGALARAVYSGELSPKSGVVSLLPYTRAVSNTGPETFRILTLGVKDRSSVTRAELSLLRKNIQGLGLKTFGISAGDFGWTLAEAKTHFPEKSACIVD